MEMATRLSKTGHTNRFADSLSEYGLSAKIPLTYVEVGLKEKHPTLSIQDTVSCYDASSKMDILLQGNGEAQFREFWDQWKQLHPHHPIYEVHRGNEGRCIPIAVHCDEGTTLKRKSLMIVQYHALVGRGSRKRKSTDQEIGINMIGNSYTTRVLWSVMLGRAYGGKRKNQPLKELISHLSAELSQAFYEGIQLKHHEMGVVYLVPVCMKGDWPALSKIGGLSRHFGRLVTQNNEKAKGICHLCKADQPGFGDWHNITYENMVKLHEGATLPWKEEPSLVAAVRLRDCDKAAFFRVDCFHVLHKGFFGDMAANALVPYTPFGCKLSFPFCCMF